ncbi:reverse transcriptase domain-containing protein [Tanacetum coccineum]
MSYQFLMSLMDDDTIMTTEEPATTRNLPGPSHHWCLSSEQWASALAFTYDLSRELVTWRLFQRQRFYIDRHTSEGDRRAVRTHMRILSEGTSNICTLHDFTVIDSPRAVTFRDKYEVQMIMRFNEIHKFSGDTLQQIDKALDYRVKEFKVNRMNPAREDSSPLALLSNPSISAIHFPIIGGAIVSRWIECTLTRIAKLSFFDVTACAFFVQTDMCILHLSNTMQTQTSNALHNAIMEAGGKDRPPMLALGIDNDIYSTIDVRPNAMEMWRVIKRKFTSRDGESLDSYYLRFYKMMNELVRNSFYHPQTYPTHYTQHSTTKSQQAATRNKGKAIANSSPTYEQEPDMVVEDDALSKEKGIDKLMALISLSFKKIYKPTNNNLRTSSNTNRANQDNTPRTNRGTRYDNQRIVNIAGARENVGTQVVHKSEIQCYNCKEYGHVERECHKSKRAKDSAYHKEKMILCKQEEAGIQLSAE